MTSALVLLAIPVAALAFGYLYGRGHQDPNTPKGRAYYARKGE